MSKQLYTISEIQVNRLKSAINKAHQTISTYSDNFMVDNKVMKPKEDAEIEHELLKINNLLEDLDKIYKAEPFNKTLEYENAKKWGLLEAHFFNQVGDTIEINSETEYEQAVFLLHKFNEEQR